MYINMNYAKTPNARPWARDLCANDLLTRNQALAVDERRLADFGYQLIPIGSRTENDEAKRFKVIWR